MAHVYFRQGEDKKIRLEIIKDGVQIDVSNAPKIKAHLIIGDILAYKYSLTPETGYGRLEVDATDNYAINLFVEREQSVNFPVGLITVVLLVSFDDVEFEDGLRVEQFNFTAGRVREGNALEEDMS